MMFRKPKKIQRRVFCADDEDDGDIDAPPAPVISQVKKETKAAKPAKTTALLSFVDEEEDDGEVFKVKKSSYSKKLSKKRDKEKRKPPDGENNVKYDNDENEDKNHTDNNQDAPKTMKKVTLEGLILSGREALAADGKGDVSDDGSGDEDEEDNRGFHTYRAESVRAALAVAPGHIPDAALIHAARKTRQQARELGDFAPVRASQPESKAGSRLVREDGSGDEDDEGRIHVRGLDLPSDKPKRGTEAAPTAEEMDSEAEEWEEQQIKKAMPALPDPSGDAGMDLNPFSLAPPPPPRVDEGPAHLRPLAAPDQDTPTTASQLVAALRQRLQELQADRQTTASKMEEFKDRLLNAARIRESRASKCSELDAAYKRAQAARGYLTDLIECLDEKMPEIEALESRALALHRKRCDFVMERRRADMRDQAQDVLALCARPGAAKPPDSEDKRRRTAEREGRRRARRLKREAAAASSGVVPRHREGDSSDDELPSAMQLQLQQERVAIREASAALFADALPAWRDVRGVCARLSRWRRRDPALYSDAYVCHCLPKLLAPYVRHQLILWNPLADEDNDDYERMDWYKCLMMFGVRNEKLASDSEDSGVDDRDDDDDEVTHVSEESVRSDPDLLLVPTIVNKVVLPKLTELVEHAWDPMSIRACVRLRQLIVRAAAAPHARSALDALSAAAHARLVSTIGADVFLPALPPQIMEGNGGAFWRRCLGGGLRLARATLALAAPPSLLHAGTLVLRLVDSLCTAAGVAPGPQMAHAAAALAETIPRTGELRTRAIVRIAALAERALSRLETDNPLHLKALEQARNVIAEAKAAESS